MAGVVANYMDTKGTCYPSLKTIAAGCHVSQRTVAEHIKELVEGGWLEKRKRGRNNFYRAMFPAPVVHYLRLATEWEAARPSLNGQAQERL